MVWVPSVYTSPGMYLVNHPVNLGTQVPSPFWFVSLLRGCYTVREQYEKIGLSCSSGFASRVFLIFNIYIFNLFPFIMNTIFLVLQLALFILVAGILCIYINYDCDRQRQEFRRTNGKGLVWGRAPSKVNMQYYHFLMECTFYFLYNVGQIGNTLYKSLP